MRIDLTSVTPENTFDEAFHKKYTLTSSYKPGGEKYAPGFAREYVIGDKLDLSVTSRTLRVDSGYLTFMMGGSLNAAIMTALVGAEIEMNGVLYRFSTVDPETHCEPYSEPSPCFEVVFLPVKG